GQSGSPFGGGGGGGFRLPSGKGGIVLPYYVQLWIFIKQILTFDYGASWSTGESVSQIILTRSGPSLTLLIPLTILQTVISIILALAAPARNRVVVVFYLRQ
ncbi:hypothetical protein ACTXQV_52370, partial [Klebsiella pneumoniae]